MQIGAIMPQQHTPWGELVEVAGLLDRVGYDSIWVIDHQLPAASASMAGSQFDAWTVLAALAVTTERATLGTLVTCNNFRHPALLAKIVTTVDHIAHGRVALGIGAGWFEQEHRVFGWSFPPVGERLDRLDEAVQVIKRVWTQTRPTFEGRFYRLDFADPGHDDPSRPMAAESAPAIGPPPLQQPHPPLIIGGSGERKTLRTVARWADEWNVAGTPAFIARKSEVLERWCAEIGRDPATIARSAYAQVIIDDSRSRVEALLERRARLTGEPVEAVRQQVVAGSPEEILEQLAAYAAVGIGRFMFQMGPPYRASIIEKVAHDIVGPAAAIAASRG